MDIIEAITARRSVRTYAGEPLTDVQLTELHSAIRGVVSPFVGDVTIGLRRFERGGMYKPSTYGVIKGACDYLLMGVGQGDDSLLAAGFKMEQVVIRAEQMGLGTCWIAATFSGTAFSRMIALPRNQRLRIVSPVGVPADRMRFIERVSRMAAGSNHRKSSDKLFFHNDFVHPLGDKGVFAEALEMMRLAPSSVNSQPWRAVVMGDERVDFYVCRKSELSLIDMGIGLCHFWLASRHGGCSGRWERLSGGGVDAPWEYVISYVR